MAIFKEQLKFTAKGSFNQTEDWWTLCYDTATAEFFIEHQWDHMDPYNLGKKASDSGTDRLSVDGYNGPGSDHVDDAKRKLLDQANA